ncbi:MAG: histidine kinase dimerization/phospho-acceptor domain-containing protein, partial [Natronincolaceae bacterium]
INILKGYYILWWPSFQLLGWPTFRLAYTTLNLVKKLRQEDRNKNTFISMLSHELRSPLATIMMSLNLLDKALMGVMLC